MRVVLAGAGIGGLTAALALDPSIEVVMLEQASGLNEVGAGLQLGPNATRVLRRLGLTEGLAEIGFEPEANEVREAATGALMLRQPLKAVSRQRWGSPYLHIHRADLQRMAAAINPKRLTPIHTAQPQAYRDLFPRVQTASNGAWIAV